MFDMTKETGAFHNIYKTGIGAETEKRILHEGNESGEGTMRRFEVAPGIQITYNDLKMDSCFRPIRFEKDFLQINHCLAVFKSPGWQRSLPTATVFCGHLQTDTGCLPVHYRKSLYQRYHSGSGLYVRTGRVQLKKMFQIYCRDLHRHLCQDETHGGCCRYVGFRADFEHWGDWKCGGI